MKSRSPGPPGPPADESELRELFRAVYGPLRRFCLRLSGDPDLADDVAQDAFVRLAEAKIQGEPAELRGWLFTTARRLVQDRVKVDENRSRILSAAPVRESLASPPDALLARRELRARVRGAMETLPERDRSLLLMSAEGFTYREIAGALDVKATSVGSLLLRARRRLRQALLDQESDDEANG